MSQIYKAGVAGTPSVPTSVTTDLQDTTTAALTAPTGSVVPQANVLRLGGDNGIKTYEVTLQPGALTIGFIRGTGTTSDAITPADLITQATNTNSTMTVQIIIAGFCTTTNVSAGAYATVVINNIAGVASVVNTADFIKNLDVSIKFPNPEPIFSVVTSGANFIVRVVGVAGLNFDWDACLPGIIST